MLKFYLKYNKCIEIYLLNLFYYKIILNYFINSIIIKYFVLIEAKCKSNKRVTKNFFYVCVNCHNVLV